MLRYVSRYVHHDNKILMFSVIIQRVTYFVNKKIFQIFVQIYFDNHSSFGVQLVEVNIRNPKQNEYQMFNLSGIIH